MKKFLIVIISLLMIIGLGAGGFFLFTVRSKSPSAVAARTLKNLQKVESASMDMQIDTDVRADVGLLSWFGIKDPETTVSMKYDIDMFKEPSLLHANVSISAFDIDSLKEIEAVIAEENGEPVRYFRWNDNWYRYVAPEDETAADDTSVSGEISGADSSDTAFVLSISPRILNLSADRQEKETSNYTETIEAVDFQTILEGIEDGSLSVEMRSETENIGDKACYVYDIDFTGDMLEKVIRFAGENKSLIPKLRADEHITGMLYIDAKESLPARLVLSTGEILSEQMHFEAIKTSLSVTKIDINVDVREYNIPRTAGAPEEYTDISDLTNLDAGDWLDAALDFTGIGDLLADNVRKALN